MPSTDIMEFIDWEEGRFTPMSGDEYSIDGNSQVLTHKLRDAIWVADFQSVSMRLDTYSSAEALIEALDGSSNTLYAWNPTRPYPIADPTGSILGASAPTIHTLDSNAFNMRLQGLPSGYVLSRGDMLHFDFGNSPVHRALHRITSTVTTAGTGITPMFSVFPAVRTGAAVSNAVTLVKAAMECIIKPGSFDPRASKMLGRISLELIQVA